LRFKDDGTFPHARKRQQAAALQIAQWESSLVSGAKLAPQGRLRKAQGASPGNKHSNKGSPEGGDAVGPGTKEAPYDEHLSGVEIELPAPPFQGFPQFGPWTQGLRPGLSCWTPSGSLVSRQKLD